MKQALDDNKKELERLEKLKEERKRYIKESLSIVESSHEIKRKQKITQEGVEKLKESTLNNAMLSGIE